MYIEAAQFTRGNWDEVVALTDGKAYGPIIERRPNGKCTCHVPTEIGKQFVVEGDYIIKNKNGFFTVRSQKFFEEEYEAVQT